jgi:CheY-like chemotaxis protein
LWALPPEQALFVLVVDDDEPTQKLLQALLRRSGYATEVAGNGRQAIDLLQSNRYAAVVLDVMMPNVGGREVVDFLSGANDPTPVVICSAAGPSVLATFDAPNIKAVIRKPFDVDEFAAVIDDLAGK